jgi:hypothetical protein
MQSTLDQFLEARCSLTSTQIEAIALRKQLERGEISPREVMGVRGDKSPGSYYRVISQARSNITQSIYTLLLASRLGVTSLEDFQRLLVLMAKMPSQPSSLELQDVTSVVDALVKKLVML